MLEKRSHANFFTQSLVLTRRSSLNMFRDLGYYWMRFVSYVILALGLGTIYYNVDLSYRSIEERGLMVAFVVSFMTFMTVGGFPSFVEDMKVFQRENLNGHYGSSAFVIGNTVSSMPYLLLISLVPGSIAYFLTGFQPGFERFIYFALVLFISMMIVESLMTNVAAIVPNFLMGIVVGAGIQGLMILSGGFFQIPNELPKIIWKYPLYYISFHRYAYQGMFKNEFEGLFFTDNVNGINVTMSGEDVLREKWQVEMGYSKWVDLAILVVILILHRMVFFLIVKTNEIFVHARKTSTSVSLYLEIIEFSLYSLIPSQTHTEMALTAATAGGNRGGSALPNSCLQAPKPAPLQKPIFFSSFPKITIPSNSKIKPRIKPISAVQSPPSTTAKTAQNPEGKWSLESWKSKPASQLPEYPDT
uniref:ABC-2 type transporter transmembrane domain-containing protein n=1 Tax=Solanum lycopersicum TaxID=4081 RepID=A0A494GA37_SOLLC